MEISFFDMNAVVVVVAGRRCGGCWFILCIHTSIGICSKGSKYFFNRTNQNVAFNVCVYAVCIVYLSLYRLLILSFSLSFFVPFSIFFTFRFHSISFVWKLHCGKMCKQTAHAPNIIYQIIFDRWLKIS